LIADSDGTAGYSLDYVSQEQEAQTANAGMWRGEFVPPWDWRAGQRITTPPQAEPKGDCLIKGNITHERGIDRERERIYHVPGSEYYSPTKINTAKGDRWFC
jgi:hypothetical protein